MHRQKSTLFILPELTHRLVHSTYNGFDQFSAVWAQKAAVNPDFPEHKTAATVRRWLRQGLPVKRPGEGIFTINKLDLSVFALSSLLDVDPLSIFDFDKNGYFSNFSAFRRVVYQNRYRMGGLAPMVAMFRPTITWPSDDIAQSCYKRPWFAKEFSSEVSWETNTYLHIQATFRQRSSDMPVALHIAYRMQNGRDPSWRYYGTVILIDGELKLYSEGGDHMVGLAEQKNTIGFRTFYGGGDVSWRIASLHAFDMDITNPYLNEKTIGFLW